MKLYQYTFGALSLISVLTLSSCHSDLDRKPTNQKTSIDIYNDPSATKQALAKVYGAWALTGGGDMGDVAGIDEGSSDFLRNYFNLQELPTDEAICAWGDDGISDLNEMSWSSSNPFVKALYYRSIIQIKFASNFLQKTASQASNSTIATYRAEARFLRAFQYWVLLDVYGNPPFITEETGTDIKYPQQIKRADLFAFIEKELKEIEPTLLAPKTNEYGRADRAAAWALLSRLYLNAEVYTGTERYADAATYAEKVITSGSYQLTPTYEHLFLADNHSNQETILAINYDGLKSQTWGGTTFLINSSSSGDARAFLGKDWGIGDGWGGNRATKALADKFDPAQDKRYLMGAQTPVITTPNTFKQGVWVYKFRNISSAGVAGQHTAFTDVDYPLLRLSEMYLNYAECAARGKADNAKGLNYLNAIRQRAYGGSSGNFSTLSLTDLIDERAREFYWEGFRRTDLIRFGLFTSASYLWPFKGGVAGGRAVSEHLSLYPLPAEDVQANSNLKQNPKY